MFVVISNMINLCIIGQVISQPNASNDFRNHHLNSSQISHYHNVLSNETLSNSVVSSKLNSNSSDEQVKSSNAQIFTNNGYKSNTTLILEASDLTPNQLLNPTVNHISSITSYNDLYQMSFTTEELLGTKYPHIMSNDIDMDPCKSGKRSNVIYSFNGDYREIRLQNRLLFVTKDFMIFRSF